MKKVILIVGSIFIIYFVIPFLYTERLIIQNMQYVPLTEETKDSIEIAYIDLNNYKNLNYERIKNSFKYCDSIVIIDFKYILNEDFYVIWKRPLIVFEIHNYGLISIVNNLTVADDASLSNEIYYIWWGLGWIKIKENIIGRS